MSTDEPFFQSIDALQEVGISAADLNKLKAAGISTVLGLQQMTRKNLAKVKGMSDAKVEKLKDAASKLSPNGFLSGSEVAHAREKIVFITTGSKALDAVIGGGISTQSITEVFGEYRTGKTQMAHTLSVTCQLPLEDGGGSGKVAVIDTENTFVRLLVLPACLGTGLMALSASVGVCPRNNPSIGSLMEGSDRIRAIAQRFGVDGDQALDNISVARAMNSEHQMELLNACAAKFAEEGCYRLLIVDSLIALFRVDFSGRGELSERQQKLNQFMARLTQISEQFNVAVFLTNQVQSDPGASSLFAGASDKKAVGGHIVAHASATRISLRKGRGDERIAKLADSPDMPEGEATYKLAAEGVMDP